MRWATSGRNRTGAARAPEMAREMVRATEEFPPSSPGGVEAIAKVRAACAREGEPLGTMPPGTPAGVPALLLDKLGERHAFEATGTRLYDALLSKVDDGRSFRGAPGRDDVRHIRDEEHEHYLMLGEAIRAVGGDPTVVTPSADVQGTASRGIPAVVADPRTDLLQSLEAILVAELVDNDGWPALIELAEQGGHAELVDRFREALQHEREHLARVRAWVALGTGRSPERARAAGAETAPGEAATRPVSRLIEAATGRPASRARRRRSPKRAAAKRGTPKRAATRRTTAKRATAGEGTAKSRRGGRGRKHTAR